MFLNRRFVGTIRLRGTLALSAYPVIYIFMGAMVIRRRDAEAGADADADISKAPSTYSRFLSFFVLFCPFRLAKSTSSFSSQYKFTTRLQQLHQAGAKV